MLPATEAVAGEQREQNRITSGHSRRYVDDRRARPHRWPVRKAIERHEAAFGLRDRIEARARRERPLAAIGRDRAIDQAWVGWRDRLIVEAKLLHHSAGKILHHDVRLRNELAGNLAGRRNVKVQHNAALVAIQA